MKKFLLAFLLIFCSLQMFNAQSDDGVVALDLPIRNSLMFNRSILNPTFSFVREQNKVISIYNKREMVQFNDAPLTYLASYSGRFSENIGAGLSLFQQNYGVLTTFGGLLNFAYNAQLQSDSNLTFGLNIGAYSSGVNTANVITNFPDPSLQDVPSNFLVSLNPGINYGTVFLDIGVSINNLVLYNVGNSTLIQDNPNKGIQGHLMYTGYLSSRGFFDDSKFSGLVRAELRKDETIVSANAMLSVPKGFWFQGGYNTLYGASGGVGLNVTKEIAIEYNYEMALGNLSEFGPSHEITLAYRIKNKRYFDYSKQDEITGLISTTKKRRPIAKKSNPVETKKEVNNEENAKVEAQAIVVKEQQAKDLAIQKAKEEKLAVAKLEAQKKENAQAEAQAKLRAEQQAKELAIQKANVEKLVLAKLEAQKKENAEAEVQAKLRAEQQAKELATQKANEEKLALARLEAQKKEKAEAEDLKAKEQALIENASDEVSKSMQQIIKVTEASKARQKELLKKYNEAIDGKDENLKNLKEENDLSDQGIAVKPKPFKSITEENNALRAIKVDLDNVIESRSEKIKQLETLYNEVEADTIVNEVVMLFYKKEVSRLNTEQSKALETKIELESRLERIKIGIEFEKRRRIKRAEYDNEEERFAQDRAVLNTIKKSAVINSIELKPEDLDFGIEQSSNIQILKNVNYAESGYYLTIAVHNDLDKRNEFITKVVASGERNVEFFYDVNTSKYFIYYQKFETIQEANQALQLKGTKAYNIKMSIVKIEN